MDAPRLPVVREHKDALVNGMRETKYRDVLRSYDAVTLFEQQATATSSKSIPLTDGRQVTAGKLVITTGASPWAAPIPGLAEVKGGSRTFRKIGPPVACRG